MEKNLQADHVFVIDRGKRVMWHCAERYKIRLVRGKLRYCVGDSPVLIGMRELNILVVQPTQKGKKRRKFHKMNDKKVKERR